MMGDLDSCLDAFKHLPYFKPLYTTILRQQMQYLTEQLSQHAGEESLVLTTNISAGTISSLTSTYGTGFLDLRADIKKQFTLHCAKNKMKYDGSLNRRNTHIDNIYTQDQPKPALKRKRPDVPHSSHAIIDGYSRTKDKHVITDGFIDSYSRTTDKHVFTDGFIDTYSRTMDKHVITDGYSQCNPVIIAGYSQTKVKQAEIDGYNQPKDKHAIVDGYSKRKPLIIDGYSQTKDNQAVIDGYSQTKGSDKKTPAIKAGTKVCEVLTDEGVVNIEIANVRSLQHGEDSAKEIDSNKSTEKLSEAAECKDSSTPTIKQEPVEDDSFMVVETTEESECNETPACHKGQDNDPVLQESGTKHLQEVEQDVETDGKNPERVVRGVSILNDETDDVITVRKSYLSSSDEGSLPEKVSTETDDVITVQNSYLSGSEEGSVSKKIVTETDGNDMWIVAGVNSETNLVDISEDKTNGLDLFDKQCPESFEEAEINKSVESVINKNFPSVAAGGFSPRANIVSDYESGAQFMFNLPTPTQIRKPLDENRAKHECRYCSQSFTCYASQKRHERRHTGETPWACEFCDKKFYRKDDLHVHSLKHSGQKPYMCPICLTGYCKKKLLEIHIASHGEWPTASIGSASSGSTYE